MTEPPLPLVDDTTAVEALHERIRELENALTLDVAGKVVVVTIGDGREPGPEVTELAGVLMHDAGAALVLVVAEGTVTFEAIDEKQMAANGWQRIDGCRWCGAKGDEPHDGAVHDAMAVHNPLYGLPAASDG